MSKLVPVTEEDKKKSYFKYYLEEMAPVAPEVYEKARNARLAPEEVLMPSDINRLFEPGYLPGELGYCALPDGSCYMANLLFMPNVTTEMIDWWFPWHSLDSLRYTIWNREDHHGASNENPEQAKNPNLSYRERLWGTRHNVIEGFGEEPRKVNVPFIHPTEMGFDREKFKAFDGTIIAMAAEDNRTTSCHFVRPVEGGVELRTRFWFGYRLVDGKVVRGDDIVLPEQLPLSLLLHNIKEFTNLARLLPRIFPEERDNF